jgi:hypothetical protein
MQPRHHPSPLNSLVLLTDIPNTGWFRQEDSNDPRNLADNLLFRIESIYNWRIPVRIAKGFMLLGMVFLAANLTAAPPSANTPPSEIFDAAVSKILVAFNSDPGFLLADRADFSTGLRPVSSRVPSVAALLARYSGSYSRQLFVGTRLRNVHELAIKGDPGLAISELMKDPNVVYARLSDPDLEAKVAEAIDRINSQTGGVWTAGYTIPGIMTPEDRRKLLGSSSQIARPATDSSSQQALNARFSAIRKSLASGQAPSLPNSFDWRTFNNTNYITPVKSQSGCGSCWAFATTGSVQDEANAYYNGNLGLNLSEQQLLSCSGAGTCVAGGYSDQAFSYVQYVGLASEACFPYADADGVPCSNMCGNPTYWKISSWSWLPGSFTEIYPLDIEIGLLAYGPLADSLEAYSDLDYYTSGIYFPTPGAIDEGGHSTVIVGFGFAAPPPALNSGSDSVLYLSEKNSWGTSWGENGFFQIFSGAALDNLYIQGIDAPAPPTAQNAICQDLDGAGHCYWGLGSKPASGCPSTCTSSTEYCAYNGSAQAPVACLTSASLFYPIPTVTVTPASSSIFTTQSLQVTVTVNGGAGTPTPTGSVTLSSGSYASAAATLSGGSAAFTIPAGSLASSLDTLKAIYTPDSAASEAYGTATGTTLVIVTTPQTITFPAIATQYAGTSVGLTATASSGLAVSYASMTPTVCTVAGATASSLISGSCLITATQAGNGTYGPASPVYRAFWVNPAHQTIAFPTIASQAAPASVGLSATASSGLPVSFASTTPTVCTVSGTTALLLVTGVCTIQVTQAGNDVYSPATVKQSFTVTGVAQTISFPTIAAQYALTSVGLTATASSGLTVSYVSTTPSVCTVSGATASLLISGSCTIEATQAGSSGFSAAPAVYRAFWVNPAHQAITFPAIASQVVLTSVVVSATASSGLAVSFASTTPTVCTVAGTTVSLLVTGACAIQATQAGNSVYSPATIKQSFTVTGLAQTITFPAIATQYAGTSVGLTATASSGLAVSYASMTPTVCTVAGATASSLISGSCLIIATQAGNGAYGSASPVYRAFWVNPAH